MSEHVSVRMTVGGCLLAFAGVCIGSTPVLHGQPAPRAVVMPVQPSGFEIKSQELLSMGENALDARDFEGAVTYFYELRDKLSSDSLSSDYVLASTLLAEACLAFPPGKTMRPGLLNKGVIEPFVLAGELLSQVPAGRLPEELAVYRGYVTGRYYQQSGRLEESLEALMALWNPEMGRRSRLKDLYNWVLLGQMQTLSMMADKPELDVKAAEKLWSGVLSLSSAWASGESSEAVKGSDADDAHIKVTMQAGQLLRRSARKDALPVECTRLKACALLALKRHAEAEAELLKPDMGVYAAERNWLLVCCMAGQNRMSDAEEQCRRCELDFRLSPSSPALLLSEGRMAYWVMFEMYYKAGQFSQAEGYLQRLEPLVRDQEQFKWLVLQFRVQAGILKQLAGDSAKNTAELALAVERSRNNCLKYAVLFPEVCQRRWLDVVSSLSGAEQGECYSIQATTLYALGKAETRVGNVNSAMELYAIVGKCALVSDSVRYDCLMALGEVASTDLRMSIQAFKDCENLLKITREQKSGALYRASVRALGEVKRDGVSSETRADMAREGESLLHRLCMDYGETYSGKAAALDLANFYYEQKKYGQAREFYQRFVRSGQHDTMKRDTARLRWSRCWRLMAEEAAQKSGQRPSEAELKDALDNLSALRGGDVDKEIRSQAYLECYRMALTMGDEATGYAMLNDIIALQTDSVSSGEAAWVALYERMLFHYQRNRLAEARQDGELFLVWRGERSDVTPWSRETYVLYGDILASLQEWDKACAMYLKLEYMRKTEALDALGRYAVYESAHCLYMKGAYDQAFEQLRRHAVGGDGDARPFTYQSTMLSGSIKEAMGDFISAAAFFEKAQGIYGSADTYKTNAAKCRQGEMFLAAAESGLRSQNAADREARRNEALKHLEQAAEIFLKLLESRSDSKGAPVEKDHWFDLYLRTQFRLGECYEAVPVDDPASANARDSALWCYKRIGDYFVERYRSGRPIKSSQYYVKSFERRIRLLTGGTEPAEYDLMDMVARLYEEYASMGLEGSLLAAKKAEQLRKVWK